MFDLFFSHFSFIIDNWKLIVGALTALAVLAGFLYVRFVANPITGIFADVKIIAEVLVVLALLGAGGYFYYTSQANAIAAADAQATITVKDHAIDVQNQTIVKLQADYAEQKSIADKLAAGQTKSEDVVRNVIKKITMVQKKGAAHVATQGEAVQQLQATVADVAKTAIDIAKCLDTITQDGKTLDDLKDNGFCGTTMPPVPLAPSTPLGSTKTP
jgi:hypothetical protein